MATESKQGDRELVLGEGRTPATTVSLRRHDQQVVRLRDGSLIITPGAAAHLGFDELFVALGRHLEDESGPPLEGQAVEVVSRVRGRRGLEFIIVTNVACSITTVFVPRHP